MIHNNEPTENIYKKIVDIASPLIDNSIFNLLLRENSQLRADYKTLIATTNKEIFNGLNIEGVWKVVKDMRVTNEWLTLAKVNRCFSQGYKAQFDIEMPSKDKMSILRDDPKVMEMGHYQELEWHVAFEQFKNMPLNWQEWP